MHPELLQILRCPLTGEELSVDHAEYENGCIRSGLLLSASGKARYPIREFVPRFVPASNYADSFGMQWNRFRQTQLDSYTGQPISAARFWNATAWRPQELAGRWILDAGCGAGRFAEVALAAGAKVVAMDYSSAVDACQANLGHHPNFHAVQADIYGLPFANAFFPYVYSLGVLQHTPNRTAAFASLTRATAPGGKLCVDFYDRSLRSLLHPKYVLRPITKRMNRGRLFSLLERSVPSLLTLSEVLGRVPIVGYALKRAVPVANYVGVLPLPDRLQREWSLLDTFDWLSPQFDNPVTAATLRSWFRNSGFDRIEVLKAGHLVGRGMAPHASGH